MRVRGHRARGHPAQRIEGGQLLHRVAPQLHAKGLRLGRRGKDLHHVAPHAKGPAPEVDVVALVLHGDEAADQRVALDGLARLQPHVHALVGLGRPDAVDAGDGGDHHDVAPLEERGGGGVPHAVDLVVDQRVLLDIGVRLRDVRFRLVVVVVGDEILHGVAGEERLELAVQLGGQRLVGRDHEGGPAQPGDHVGQREGLAAPRDAEEHGVRLPFREELGQALDGPRLIARRLELG